MKIIALETSGQLGSVALLETEGKSIASAVERTTPADQRTARSLLPTVRSLLQERNWRPGDLELVVVTTGPGSFTGLRIGAVAAKTLAYAIGVPLVGVHSLAALAEGVQFAGKQLWTILDAQRQELFVASFVGDKSIVEQATPPTDVIAVDAWLGLLAAGDVVAGPPLEKLRSQLPAGVEAADRRQWSPSASVVGRLGFSLFVDGMRSEPLELLPNYYRLSAAEEKAAAEAVGQGLAVGDELHRS